MKKQGQQTDLIDTVQLVQDGATLMDIQDIYQHVANESVQYQALCRHRNDKLLRMAWKQHDDGIMPELFIITGQGGISKTQTIWDNHPKPEIFDMNIPDFRGGPIWWDGYDGQDVVIFDEFEGQIPMPNMKRFMDRYPCRAPVKGGFVTIVATKFYITSNKNTIQEWWPNATELEQESFRRRITKWTIMTG
jgi:hypothetical protein